VAFDINTAGPSDIVATFDSAGRVVLTSVNFPAQDAPSVVVVGPDETGANGVLGWSNGGETVLRSALVAPTFAGVLDGWPLSAPDAGQGFWVLFDERQSVALEPLRRYEYDVTIPTLLFKPELGMQTHRDREAIGQVVRAVRECLHTLVGRYAGTAGQGTIQLVSVRDVHIGGQAFSFTGKQSANVLFDTASLTITARVFARPAGA
jgi:hypothetical protein